MQSTPSDTDLTPLQIEIYCRMDPGRKIAIAMDLLRMALELKRAGIRLQEPGLDDKQVQQRLVRILLYGQ
ncbi:MAG: hypothetical protein QHH07_09570 [Sedimentisphaerales bacterium]|jgi:hypothetical protein|nr:hypothetical protein [Sedimentisphaerales bacterium]